MDIYRKLPWYVRLHQEILKQRSSLFTKAAAAGTVQIEAGVVTLAGGDVSIPRIVALEAGSLTLAGSQLATASAVAIQAGAVTASGNQVNILQSPVVSIQTGVITVSGSDLSISSHEPEIEIVCNVTFGQFQTMDAVFGRFPTATCVFSGRQEFTIVLEDQGR